jgi:hypothetical protein
MADKLSYAAAVKSRPFKGADNGWEETAKAAKDTEKSTCLLSI